MGHLFRALTLADFLRAQGVNSVFVVNDDPASAKVLSSRGFRRILAGQGGDNWVGQIVRNEEIRIWVDDRLDTDVAHAQSVRNAGARRATFDDRGAGAALADLNVVALARASESLAGKKVLTGLSYMVIDPAIGRYRRKRTVLGSRVVAMGGSDTYGLTVAVVRALREASLPATVVLGPGFRHDQELFAVIDSQFVIKRGIASLPEEFASHDLAITAAGITLFEAAAAGLPCIAIPAEVWELEAARMMEKKGACLVAGYRAEFDVASLGRPLPLECMSEAALATLDAGGTARVASEILAL